MKLVKIKGIGRILGHIRYSIVPLDEEGNECSEIDFYNSLSEAKEMLKWYRTSGNWKDGNNFVVCKDVYRYDGDYDSEYCVTSLKQYAF